MLRFDDGADLDAVNTIGNLIDSIVLTDSGAFRIGEDFAVRTAVNPRDNPNDAKYAVINDYGTVRYHFRSYYHAYAYALLEGACGRRHQVIGMD